MKYVKVRIVIGSSDSLFDIYYNSIDSNKRALIYSTGLPATGLTYEELSSIDGVLVSVPDETTSIVLSSEPNAFCSENSNVNNDSYTIPIGCYTYTITSDNSVSYYSYIDCECNEISTIIDGTYGQVEHTFCAMYGTVNAGDLEVTLVQGCEVVSIELCYDENEPGLACDCGPAPTICYELENSTNISGECFGCTGIYASERTTSIRFLNECGGAPISPSSNMDVIVTYSNGSTETTTINSGSSATYTVVGSSDTTCGPNCTEIASPTVVSVQVTSQSEGIISECCSTPTPTPTPTIGCLNYTVSTTSGTGQSYSYTNCDGTPGGGNIGGASGYDADTFCAQIGTVVLIGSELTLSSGDSCSVEPTPTPTPTPTIPTETSITATAGGGMEPCIGGTIDDYMSASVTLSAPVTVDTNFDVTVYYQQVGGSSCGYPNITSNFANSTSFTVTVLAGEINGYVDACTQGQNFPSGANICGACVTNSDNTVDTITFNNPLGC